MILANHNPKLLSVTFGGVLLIYLAIVNYQIPFTTLDEFSWITASESSRWSSVKGQGRTAHYISMMVNPMLEFSVPSAAGLTPRYLSMVSLAVSLVMFLTLFRFSISNAIPIVAIALVSHQLDWQHNGLIAFFGVYPFLLSLFIFGIIIDLKTSESWSAKAGATLLLLLTYASELFVGLSIIYLAAGILVYKKVSFLARSPFLYALAVFFILHILAQQYSDPTLAAGMRNYMSGALFSSPVAETIRASLLYLAFSLPFLNNFLPPSSVAPLFIGATLFLAGTMAASWLIFISLRTPAAEKSGGKDQIPMFTKQSPLLITLLTLMIAPQILMAFQPNKAHWILTGASTRYAFSLYTWLGLVVLIAIFLKRLGIFETERAKPIFLLVSVAAIAVASFAADANLKFANSYLESKEKWLKVDSISRAATGLMKIPATLLIHPYILPIDAERMKSYVGKVYSKKAVVCSADVFHLSDGDHEMVDLGGFHGAERDGRWASESAFIQFNTNLPSHSAIVLTFSATFGANDSGPSEFILGNTRFSHQIRSGSRVVVPVTEPMASPRLYIRPYRANSPSELGAGPDNRKLGIKISSVRVQTPSPNGQMQDILSGCW